MRLEDFDFPLSKEQIAQRPVSPRDAARLLCVRGDSLHEATVRDLPSLLQSGDALVVNDAKVIPARLLGRRGEVAIEVTLHREEAPDCWRAFVRPARRLRVGDRITFGEDFAAEVAAKDDSGDVKLYFDRAGSDLSAALEEFGAAPLPPYIRRVVPDPRDRLDYQTVYAERSGSIAAPTAGLHFTNALLRMLAAVGVDRIPVTLHVGAGTFLPVRVEELAQHQMHAERGEVGLDAVARIEAARSRGGRIIAVGTTALRALESAVVDGELRPWAGETSLFITPGYKFRVVDRLMTNFHLPRSTLFMLVAAFSGLERMKRAYAYAAASGYRFYSYGDACLLDRASPE